MESAFLDVILVKAGIHIGNPGKSSFGNSLVPPPTELDRKGFLTTPQIARN